MLTGRPHQPMNFENANPGAPNDAPGLGALFGMVTPSVGGMPRSITLPHRIWNTDGSVWPGQDAGLLGRAADPWLLHGTPSPSGLSVGEIVVPPELSPERIAGRRDLLDRLARGLDVLDRSPVTGSFDVQSRQAFDLLRSSKARDAFRIDAETAEVRELYGSSPFGQSVLMSRRLVEAGVKLVQVNWYRGADEPSDNPVWDTHVDEPKRLKEVLAPPADRAIAGLITDLDRRGRLDETLVVCLSEFGRSPRLDAKAGRNHWGSVFSVMLAGGGIRGGMAYGSSDRFAAQPRENRVRPEDLLATIFHCLGHAPGQEFRDPLDRPHPISRGEVIRAIVS
jgi:hypothetical protein